MGQQSYLLQQPKPRPAKQAKPAATASEPTLRHSAPVRHAAAQLASLLNATRVKCDKCNGTGNAKRSWWGRLCRRKPKRCTKCLYDPGYMTVLPPIAEGKRHKWDALYEDCPAY